MTSYEPVSPEEANDRKDRVLSVACPRCHAEPLQSCKSPAGARQIVQHTARWDAWYAAHPEASAPTQEDVSRWINELGPAS